MKNITSRSEGWIVTTLCLAFLLQALWAVNLVPVWPDEVMYSDPPVNLYLGHGFVSRGWHFQTGAEFWAGNVPLHELLLYR